MTARVSGIAARGSLPAWMPWVLGSAFILTFFLRDYLGSRGGIIADSAYWGRDFINVWTGGQLVREGRIELIYDLGGYAAYQRTLFGGIEAHNYSYPPVSFPLAALLSLLPYQLALAAWTGGTGAFFVWAARPWWPQRWGPAWLALLTPAAVLNIWAGHYGFLVGALFLLGWQKLERNPRQAGMFFGLMLIKPHLALLVPLVLLIRRQWEAIAWAAATVAALMALTVALYGWEPWHDFLFRTSGVQAGMIDPGDTLFATMSASTLTGVLRSGGSWPLALTLHLAVAAAALAIVAKAAVRQTSDRDLAFLTATATFLILPYSFNYDMTVVMIGALAVLARNGIGPADERLAIYGFLAPQLGMILAILSVPLMPLMLLGLAVAQYRTSSAGRGARQAEQAQPPAFNADKSAAA